MLKQATFLAAALVLLAGCASLTPDYERPAAPIPQAWSAASAPEAAPGAATADADWRDVFADPALQRLIDQALDNNRDLRQAALNIERARALYQIQRAEQFPAVDAVGGADIQRVPRDLSAYHEAYIARQYSVGLAAAAYELDFFGRVRSLKDQALEQYLATEEARRSARVSLIAEVAAGYLRLAADRERLDTARDTLQSRQAALELTRLKFGQGLATELDANQAKSSVEAARADAARYVALAAQDENALALLAGSPLTPDQTPARSLADVAMAEDLTPGLPSELLTRRPDIRQAERLLRAANANIGAARARFFPSVTLTSSFGLAAPGLSDLFKTGARTWAFAPQIDLPIFDAGARRANLEAAEVERDVSVAQYEKAIQSAFREVADALAERGTIDERVDARASQAEAAATSQRLSEMRFREGLDSFFVVLDSQRALYDARQALITERLAKMNSLLTLYKALGGGWSGSEADRRPDATAWPAVAVAPAGSEVPR